MRWRRWCQPPSDPSGFESYLVDREIRRLIGKLNCEGGRPARAPSALRTKTSPELRKKKEDL